MTLEKDQDADETRQETRHPYVWCAYAEAQARAFGQRPSEAPHTIDREVGDDEEAAGDPLAAGPTKA